MNAFLPSCSSHGHRSSIKSHEPTFVKEETKLGSFLSLSEHSKNRAREAKKRQSYLKNEQSYLKKERSHRRSSILNSLDKFLDEDEVTVSTINTSMSSGLSADISSSRPAQPSRMAQHLTPTTEEGQMPPVQERYRRRGSVTRYSLEPAIEQTKAADLEAAASFDDHSVQSDGFLLKKKSDRPRLRHKQKSVMLKKKKKNMVPTRQSSMRPLDGDLAPTIDQKPVPMRKASMRSLPFDGDDQSVATIDQLPIPLRQHGHDSTQSFRSFKDRDDQSVTTVDQMPIPRRLRGPGLESSHSLRSIGDDSKLPPRPGRSSSDRGMGSLAGLSSLPNASPEDRLQDNHSVASSACGEEGRSRYRRRGSVTKISLEANQIASLKSLPRHSEDAMHCSRDDDDRSIISEKLPPRPRPPRPSRPASGKSKGSLACLSSLPKSKPITPEDRLQDDSSIASSVSGEEGRARYRRRGSVTKFSLEANQASSLRSLADDVSDPVRDSYHNDARSTVSEKSTGCRRFSLKKTKPTIKSLGISGAKPPRSFRLPPQ